MLRLPRFRVLAAIMLAALLPLSEAALAQTFFDDQRRVENRNLMRHHRVTLNAETRVRLTYDAEKIGNGCHLRIRIYRRIDHGDRDYRILDRPVHLRNEGGDGELFATLPPGQYRFDVDAKRMDIHVTLIVAPDDDGDE